jgi:hypothetical protein
MNPKEDCDIMSWFDILKAELVEPKTIVDVTTGKTSNDECCEKVVELMNSEGHTWIGSQSGQPEFGFNKKIDRTKPMSEENHERVSYTLNELMSDAMPQYGCDWLYEYLDSAAHFNPIGASGKMRRPPKGRESGWQERADKFSKYLKVWDDCLEKKGTEGMKQ